MAIVITGTKTVTLPAAQATAASLTAMLAKAPEQLSIKELQTLHDACATGTGGSNPATLIGAILI
jgi:hypothetical protein